MLTLKKLFYFFSPSETKQTFALLALIILTAFVDTLGVASILPFMTLVLNPSIIEDNILLKYLYNKSSILGVTNTDQFIIVFGITFFFFIIFSFFLRSSTIYFQMRFALLREYTISRRLLESYLCQPYSWFLKNHSAEIAKNILNEVGTVVGSFIMPIISFVSNSLVVIMLITLCFLINPKITFIIVLVFGTSYLLIFYFVKNILSRFGNQRLIANEQRYKLLSEAFGAAKEVKVGGLENIYINRYSKVAQIYATSLSISSIIEFLPRFFIEAIAFGGLILYTLLIFENSNFQTHIPIISFYAYVGFKLLPALQAVYGNLTKMRSSKPSLDNLYKSFTSLSSNYFFKTSQSIYPKKSIEFKNINFTYSDTKYVALKNVNFTIPAYSKIGIIGPTGSGKSTTIDIILGLLDASSGYFKVDDTIINIKNKRSWQKNIGYVPQQIYLSDASIAENIAFGVDPENINYYIIKKVSKMVNLHDFVINDLPNNYRTLIGEKGVRLSGGQRQKIAIARALYKNPKVLILDEATNSLDNITENTVIDAINNIKKKITIILITHRLASVKKCDIIFLFDKGKLKAQGNYNQLKKNTNFFNN
jgi:ATP-binding cassette, subfamily B, bacterial PglK